MPFRIGYLYRLEGHTPVAVSSFEEFMRWELETLHEQKIVRKDVVGGVEISTVFLGRNHQFRDGPPLVFETMVFGGAGDYQARYSTWEQAEQGHARALAQVLAQTQALVPTHKAPDSNNPPDPSLKTRLERVEEED